MQTLEETPAVQSRFATVTEAAEYLNVARSTVYELMNSGELPSKRIRRCRRIEWSDLEAFADAAADA